MPRTWRVTTLPGEGIGPEVTAAGVEVLSHVARLEGFEVAIRETLFGIPAFEACGSYFPPATIEACRDADGILLGAVERGGLLEVRSHFDFFANLRPVRAIECLLDGSTMRREHLVGVDLLFVRELTSGLPFGAAGRGADERGPYGFHTMRYHDYQIRRIARTALEQAARRRGRLAVAHKENALPRIPWCDLVREEAAAFSGVEVETVLVDTLAMELVMTPRRFDVILSENLTGDWLSSLGAGLVGAIGLFPSASVNAGGFGLYEPVHGTAPELVGRGVANPLGAVGSVAMMLRQWGEAAAAGRIEAAVDAVLAAGYRTPDLGSAAPDRRVSTRGMTDCLLAALDRARDAGR